MEIEFDHVVRGTTFVAAVMKDDPINLVKKCSIVTRTPQETCNEIISFFQEYLKSNEDVKKFEALGVASFGPIDLDINSKTCVKIGILDFGF